MTYVPAESLRFAAANEASGLSFLRDAERDNILLLTGTSGIFVAGNWAGTTDDQQRLDGFQGGVIENVAIEVDEASVATSESAARRPLSLVRRGASFYVVADTVGRSLASKRELVEIMSGLPAGGAGVGLVYDRWRIVLPRSTTPIVLHEVEAIRSSAGS